MKYLANNTTSNTPDNSMAYSSNNSMGNSSNNSMANSSNKAMSNSSNHTVSNSVANSNSLRVDSSALVGHLSHVSVNIVGVVVDVLDTAVRKVDGVGALPGSSAIVRLRGVKASSRVVVGHSVLVGEGGNLVRVNLSHSMTHNTMSDTNSMADADAVSDSNSMTNSNTVTNSNSVTNSDTMSNSSKELRGGRCCSCQGRNNQSSLKILEFTQNR